MRAIVLTCLLIILFTINTVSSEEECPNKCNCKRSTQKDGGIKLKCGDIEKVSDIEQLDFLNLANEIAQL